MRQHAREPRTGPKDHPVGRSNRVDRLRTSRGGIGDQPDLPHRPRRRGDGVLPTHRFENRRRTRENGSVSPNRVVSNGGGRHVNSGLNLERYKGHRQHPAACIEQAANPVQPGDRVAQPLPQRDDEQVADSLAVELAGTGEPMLEHVAPRAPPLVVAAQSGQRHS